MRHIALVFALVGLFVLGCGDDEDYRGGGGDADADKDMDCDGVIDFPDTNLEDIIRNEINKPTGDIYSEDVSGLTALITESFSISDSISDITGIQCLTNLGYLILDENQIADISPLSDLTNLTALGLALNQISDISPLSDLVNLTSLNLYYNNITNISPLSGLTNLTALNLRNNQITDISALADNTGIGSGDTVELHHNSLDCTDQAANVQALVDRGVDLWSECTD